MGGGQEAQRQQQMDLQSRMAPLQGMQGLQALLRMPGFQAGPNYLAAAGMQGQYGLDATQMNNQAQADYWQGLMQLANAGARASGGG